MSKYFNVDIENIITDYELSYQNANEQFTGKFKQIHNDSQKRYSQRIEESRKKSKQLSDINNKIAEDRNKLQHIVENVECELQTISAETSRLESISNECNLLETKENALKDEISQQKAELAQVYKDKKGKLKKLKREINSFKAGVNMYQTFLQMDMKIVNKNSHAVINITLKNLNTDSSYDIVLEENDNTFRLIDIMPRSQSVIQAATLYSQNKDIQGLLAYLFNIKE